MGVGAAALGRDHPDILRLGDNRRIASKCHRWADTDGAARQAIVGPTSRAMERRTSGLPARCDTNPASMGAARTIGIRALMLMHDSASQRDHEEVSRPALASEASSRPVFPHLPRVQAHPRRPHLVRTASPLVRGTCLRYASEAAVFKTPMRTRRDQRRCRRGQLPDHAWTTDGRCWPGWVVDRLGPPAVVGSEWCCSGMRCGLRSRGGRQRAWRRGGIGGVRVSPEAGVTRVAPGGRSGACPQLHIQRCRKRLVDPQASGRVGVAHWRSLRRFVAIWRARGTAMSQYGRETAAVENSIPDRRDDREPMWPR